MHASRRPFRQWKKFTSTILIVAAMLASPMVAFGNAAPTISGTAPDGMVGYAYSFRPQTSDANGDSLTFSISNKPSWAGFNNKTGILSGTPTAGMYGTYSNIRITVSDGRASRSRTFSITVDPWSPNGPGTSTPSNPNPPTSGNGSNTAPKISGTAPQGMVGYAYSFKPQSNDADGDTLSFSISNKPSWAAFNTKTGVISGTPRGGMYGNYSSIRITVSDGKASASATFSISVAPWSPEGPGTSTPTNPPNPPNPPSTGSNTAPKISGTAPQGMVGYAYSFKPQSSDADGDSLSFSISNKPSWASFNTKTGAISGTPGGGKYGTYSNIRITVSDSKASASATFSIVIAAWEPEGPDSPSTPTNPPTPGGNAVPKIWGAPNELANVGQAYNFTPQSSDADGDKLTFSISNKPGWASFNSSTGRLSGTPGGGNVGTYSNIRITVSDGRDSAAIGFDIRVVAAADDATTVSWQPPTRNEDGTVLTNLAGYYIYYGTTPGEYSKSIRITNPSITTYVLENLVPDTYYLTMTAYTTDNVESRLAGEKQFRIQ